MSSSRSLRLVAAVLAMVGLLARPARAVVLCPMEMPVAAETAAADEHAHHADHAAMSDAAPSSQSHAERPAEPKSHGLCPDLAHCAVAAPASANEIDVADDCVRAERLVSAQDRPASAIASLEPPPPKRS